MSGSRMLIAKVRRTAAVMLVQLCDAPNDFSERLLGAQVAAPGFKATFGLRGGHITRDVPLRVRTMSRMLSRLRDIQFE